MKLISNMNMISYSLMVCDARGAILNPGAQISKAEAEFMPPGAQYWSQGRNTKAPRGWIFLTMFAPGVRPAIEVANASCTEYNLVII